MYVPLFSLFLAAEPLTDLSPLPVIAIESIRLKKWGEARNSKAGASMKPESVYYPLTKTD